MDGWLSEIGRSIDNSRRCIPEIGRSCLPLVFGGLYLLAWGSRRMAAPDAFGAPLPISLDPAPLPE